MGQQALLRKPDSGGELNLPKEPPDSGLSMLMDAISGLLGMDAGEDYTGRQMPGSPANGAGQMIGAATPMLPLKKLMSLLQGSKAASTASEIKPAVNVGDKLLREHLWDELPEFAPVTHGVHPPLPSEEAAKELALTSQKRKPSAARPISVGPDLQPETNIDDASFLASQGWQRDPNATGPFSPQDLADIVSRVLGKKTNVEGFAGTLAEGAGPKSVGAGKSAGATKRLPPKRD